MPDPEPIPLARWLGRPVGPETTLWPPLALAVLYALAMALGAWGFRSGWAGGLSWADAAFTAVSAVTVTGLSTVPLHSALTPAGQALQLGLIQLGGLGLMTVIVLALRMVGGGPDRAGELLRADLEFSLRDHLARAALRVMIFAALAQGAGAAIAAVELVPAHGLAGGVGRALFLAGSAFCNAGFTPFAGSMRDQPALVLAVTAALFVLGGLGFLVLDDLWKWLRRRRAPKLHSRVVLAGTLVLALLGWAAIAALEWGNPATLGAHPPAARPGLALFQALTPRTAGFDAVGASGYGPGAEGVTILLMLVGAGVDSTGGGLKIATAALLVAAGWAALRRQGDHAAAAIRLTPRGTRRVAILALATTGLVAGAALVLQRETGLPYLDTLFEAASAFGTVGLSAGVTDAAAGPGRSVLMVLMFLGRIGPLTLAWLLLGRLLARDASG
ncbi:potassium transporter TrkG [Jannaschia ovalis]|uniref:Potassium transporter TrkG n=1 Tax=Jannaschia ovalis TaxID=3038773 RepID=A0ABY8LFK2_9RHOB|nr:potassium transporter TrkG [Jannaschia sp. GRR-S6-38]WGH79921.1 potassium transporter TrkG [Jannaschia sp. GRR-S6-38]